MSKKILISAGEVSGDRYAAKLVSELKALDPSLTFIGMGGEHLKKQGVNILIDLTGYSTIGFIEPFKYFVQIFFAYFKLKSIIKKEKPGLIIPVDFQGFNLALLKVCKKYNVPAIYYISPQEWQWGSEKGGRKVTQLTKIILSIHKEAVEFYNSLGGNAQYIGHPILDLAVPDKNKSSFYQEYNLQKDNRIISIFPGSRKQEIKYIAPILFKAAKLIKSQFPDIQFFISIANHKLLPNIQNLVDKLGLRGFIFYTGHPDNLIINSTLSLVSSGTITLEHAVLNTPFISVYKFSRLSYWLAKMIMGKKFNKRVKFISLPNILLEENVAPEFLQNKALYPDIYYQAVKLLSEPQYYKNIKNRFSFLKTKIGPEGATKKAAKEIINFLEPDSVA